MVSLDPSVYSRDTLNGIDSSPGFSIKRTWYARFGKRIFDIVVALLVSVLILSWMIPILGAAICLTSAGPPLFIQKRTGRNGRVFRCFKFRTMHHARKQAFAQARQNDPRVTSIGRTLRQTNLDEMPQFLNVLLGDMSLVGPRPHAVEHDNMYWHKIDQYYFRYTVRPGITGLAQVRGARGETSALIKMKHRVRYDLHYMKKQTFSLDLWLFWLTLKQMLKGTIKAW